MMEKAQARRTLQRRLALLVEQKRLTIEGRGRGIRYRITANKIEGHLILPALRAEGHIETYVPISPEGEEIRKCVREPIQNRRPVGYNRSFIDAYRPNDPLY